MISEGAVEKHVANIFMESNLPVSQSDHRRVLAVLKFLGLGDPWVVTLIVPRHAGWFGRTR